MTVNPEMRTPEGERATAVILLIFRANGLLIAAGDELTAEHGLTSARWQVLAALNEQDRPLTVPQIARRRGITRQSVHASVDRLLADGLVALVPNDDHKRSQLVWLTDVGRARLHAVYEKQFVWVNRLASGLSRAQLETTARVLSELCGRLEAMRDQSNGPEGEEP